MNRTHEHIKRLCMTNAKLLREIREAFEDRDTECLDDPLVIPVALNMVIESMVAIQELLITTERYQ